MSNKQTNKQKPQHAATNPFKAVDLYAKKTARVRLSPIGLMTFDIPIEFFLKIMDNLFQDIESDRRLMELCNTPSLFYKA